MSEPATGNPEFPFFAVVFVFEDGDVDTTLIGSFPAEVDELDPETDDYRAVVLHNREELVCWANKEYGDGEWHLLELADMGELWKRRQHNR